MGRFARLPSAVLFRLGLITCCGALLAGLALLMLGLPESGQAQSGAPAVAFATLTPTKTFTPTATATKTATPTATATPKPSPTATSTPSPTATSTPKPAPTATSKPAATATPRPAATATQPAPTATTASALGVSTSTTPGAVPSSTVPATTPPGRAKDTLARAPSWLVGGLVGVFVLLLVFSLIIFPLAMRSARAERSNQLALTVAPPRRPSGQVARLTQIPPERKEPLSRAQMLALRESQQVAAISGVSEQSTASLAAIRVVDGVPVSLPLIEAETAQLPVAKRSVVSKIVESTTARLPAVRPAPALLPPPQQQMQQES
jgi:hypothetical protein